MATKIRLKRLGKIRSPHYRIIVIDERAKRDGKAIEEVGIYHPKNDPSVIQVNSERVQYWLGVGAQPSDAVVAILKRTGDWQTFTGDTSIPSGVDEKPAKRSKLDLFNEALAEQDDAPKTSAITTKAKKDADEAPAGASESDDSQGETPATADVAEPVAPAGDAAADDQAGKTDAEPNEDPAEGKDEA